MPRNGREYRETADVAEAVGRLIRAVGKRVAVEDPPDLLYLVALDLEVRKAFAIAIEGLRCSGFTDREIGQALGTTRQAVEQRWPRSP